MNLMIYIMRNENVWYCKICTIFLSFCKTLRNSNKSDIGNKLSNNTNVNLKNLLLSLRNLKNDEKYENNDLPNSKYKDQEYAFTFINNMKSKCLSILHLNISSLQKHFDNFECFLDEMKLEFDLIDITESRILKTQSPSNNSIYECTY